MDKPPIAIKAVFFDIGNVLLEYDLPKALKRFAWAVNCNPMKIAKLLWSRRMVEEIERGRLGGPALFDVFCREFSYKGSYLNFKALWCGPFRLIRKTDGIMQRVGTRVPIYLLSNTNELHYEFIEEHYAFPRRVQGALLSHRLGLRKPQAEIYAAALAEAGVSAGEALFIDDLKQNVQGARQCGWQGIRYVGPEPLERELKKLRVL